MFIYTDNDTKWIQYSDEEEKLNNKYKGLLTFRDLQKFLKGMNFRLCLSSSLLDEDLFNTTTKMLFIEDLGLKEKLVTQLKERIYYLEECDYLKNELDTFFEQSKFTKEEIKKISPCTWAMKQYKDETYNLNLIEGLTKFKDTILIEKIKNEITEYCTRLVTCNPTSLLIFDKDADNILLFEDRIVWSKYVQNLAQTRKENVKSEN